MPSLDDISKIVDSFEQSPLAIIPERCVQVRNRNASCERCLKVCRVDALEIQDNEIALSAAVCVNCGACAAVCPTEALIMLEPARASVVERLEEIELPKDEPLCIVCARMAARKEIATERCVVVPCLAYVDEALLLKGISQKDHDIVLVDALCSTCKYGWNDERIDQVMVRANELLVSAKSSHEVSRIHEAPVQLIDHDTKDAFGDERRHFFSQAAQQMKQTALTAAQQTIESKLGMTDHASIYDHLHVGATGTLPQFEMPRHMELLDALDSFEPAQETRFDSPLLGNVIIDTQLCNLCGMCVTFCPTGALSVASYLAGSHTPKQFDFQACDCVGCELCENVCLKYALTLSHDITAQSLFSFEPRALDLGTRKPKMR